MTEGSVVRLLEKFMDVAHEYLLKEVSLVIYVREDFNSLCDELEPIISLVKDIEGKSNSISIRKWLKKLEVFLRDAVDTVNECQKAGKFCNPIFRHKMGRKIKKLNERIAKIHFTSLFIRKKTGLKGNLAETTESAGLYVEDLSSVIAEYVEDLSSMMAEYLLEERPPVISFRDDFNFLHDQLEPIKSLLKDIKGRSNSISIRKWLQKLEVFRDDAVDIVEECQAAEKFSNLVFRHKMGRKIKKLNERITRIYFTANSIRKKTGVKGNLAETTESGGLYVEDLSSVIAEYVEDLSSMMAEYLLEERPPVISFRDDFNFLHDQLEPIKSLLKDIKGRSNSISIRKWLQKLEVFLDDVVDIVEECQAAEKFSNLVFRHKMGCKIKKLNERITRIYFTANSIRKKTGVKGNLAETTESGGLYVEDLSSVIAEYVEDLSSMMAEYLLEERPPVISFRDYFNSLHDQLEPIKSLVKDIQSKSNSISIRKWFEKLEVFLDDAVDIVEECQAAEKFRNPVFRHKMGRKIKKLKERITKIHFTANFIRKKTGVKDLSSMIAEYVEDLSSMIVEYLLDEASLVSSFKEDFKALLHQVTSMSKDVRDKRKSFLLFLQWYEEFEDFVEDFVEILDKCGAARNIPNLILRHWTGREIKKLNERIKDIHIRQIDWLCAPCECSYVSVGSESFSQDQSERSIANARFLQKESPPVGMENDIEKITDLILKAECPRVIAVVGAGGQGKTLLAQSVSKSQRVEKYFQEHRSWVVVSQKWDAKSVFQQIGSQLKLGVVPTEEEIVNSIAKLEGKRCLFVFDDVWDTENAQLIEFIKWLVQRKHNIVITSHNRKVAESFRDAYIHTMSYLSEEHSWKLFCIYAFPYVQSKMAS